MARIRVRAPEAVEAAPGCVPVELADGCVIETWADPVKLDAYFDNPTFETEGAVMVSAFRRFGRALDEWGQAHPDASLPSRGRPRWAAAHPEPPRARTPRKRVAR